MEFLTNSNMIMTILAIILSLVFFLLSIIHFSWALGGQWGFENSLPTNEKGERILNPRKIDSALVGLGLLYFSLYYLLFIKLISIPFPTWLLDNGIWIIAGIFILRSLGEFKYLGFFKKIKNTEFGKMDSKFYSPLCFVIGLLSIFIKLMS